MAWKKRNPVEPAPLWMVVNQTEALGHQRMWERLADALGPCVLLTGLPFPVEGSRLLVVRGPSYSRQGMAARVAAWLRFTSFAAGQLARVRGRPFVLAVSNPPFNALLAWLGKRVRGLRYGLLVWDLYPDHVVAMGWLPGRHPLIGVWRELNRRALAEADFVITLSPSMAAALRAAADGRIEADVVPNWADTQAIRPLPKAENPFARAQGVTDRLVVLYAGNLGATHGLEALVEAAASLVDGPEIAFLLVGDGLGLPAARALAERLGATNVRFLPPQPWEALPDLLATGDIAVVSQAPHTEHLSLPSKLYTAMAAGSAILALTAMDSDLARTVLEYDAGRVCGRDDAPDIARAILELAGNPSELARLRANARRAAETTFSEDAAFEALLRRLNDALGAASPRAERHR